MSGTADNTAYTTRFVRLNFGFAEISYMLGTLGGIAPKVGDSND